MSEATQRHDAVVVGAGPSGLGTAACLAKAGLDVVLLEQGADVATQWRNGYDSLRLNTSSWFSYLPEQRFPRELGRWAPRDQLVQYYRDYAGRYGLRVHAGVRAERLEQDNGGWQVRTTNGVYEGAIAVVATGKHRTPTIPDWPGLSEFEGTVIHSTGYRNAVPFRGRRVLVVGTGNSGIDIAVDLSRGAAAETWLSARRPPHIVRRELRGLPHDAIGVASRRLPRSLADAGRASHAPTHDRRPRRDGPPGSRRRDDRAPRSGRQGPRDRRRRFRRRHSRWADFSRRRRAPVRAQGGPL